MERKTTAALKALYDSYVAENLNKADYTAESWAVYEAKMNEAKALIEAKDTTNAAAGEALTALQTAHDRLVKLNPDPQPGDVDKSGLTTLYNQYKDTKADGYTAESWTAFNEALMKAQSVLANPNATQDEVNAAKEALQTAYDGLVKDTTPDPNPNPNPDGNGGVAETAEAMETVETVEIAEAMEATETAAMQLLLQVTAQTSQDI